MVVDRVFHALSDPTRRDIVARTLQQEYSVSALARMYPMTITAVQKHVAVLEEAGLVRKRRQGREQLVSADIAAIRVATDALDQFELLWRCRADRMQQLLDEDTTKGTPR